MRRYLLLGAGLALLAGTGAALAQMPPHDGPPPMDRGGPHEWGMEHHPHHPRFMPGAGFRLRKGDAEIDIKCSVHESTKDCVDAALRLMDAAKGAAPAPAQ